MEMGMYRKLQRKILWGSTLVLLLVIAAVVGIIYWVSINIVEQPNSRIGKKPFLRSMRSLSTRHAIFPSSFQTKNHR